MRVVVVGAGLAGLAAARELVAAGCTVTVVEKSRGLGGRMAARRIEGTVVDHGLPVLEAPEGGALAGLVGRLAVEDRVRIERPELGPDGAPIGTGAPRWGWGPGMTRLPKAMAENLEVVTGARVAALRAGRDGIEVAQDQGNTLGVADRVIVSAPAPQAADLLEASPEGGERVAALRAVAYAPAVMILAGLRLEAEPEWSAVRPGDGPLMRVGIESAKGRPPVDGVVPVVARMTAAASARLMDAADDLALDEALPALAAVLGEAAREPAWSQVKRWRYAVPTRRLDQEVMNPGGSRVILCGDAVAADPGIAAVHETGIWAARRVLGGA
jgi:hypothetical protein